MTRITRSTLALSNLVLVAGLTAAAPGQAIGTNPTPATIPATQAQAPHPAAPILGDTNGDCVVDVQDQLKVLACWGLPDPVADLDGDGTVDDRDLAIVQAVWGSTCGTRLIGDANGSGVVNNSDLTKVLGDWGTATAQSDFDRDGVVGDIDLNMLLANWGRNLARRLLADVNGDDLVDVVDLVAVLGNWAGIDALADVNGDGLVNEVDLNLVQAQWGATSGRDLLADVNGDKIVGQVDLDLVEATFGTNWARADLDSNGVVDVQDLSTVLGEWGSIAGRDLAGDVNGDWVVDKVDTNLVVAVFGTSWPQADVVPDGTIDVNDLVTVLGNYGSTFGCRQTGDINGDCAVDETDRDILLAVWGSLFPQADLDGDGDVDVQDLVLLLANWGIECP